MDWPDDVNTFREKGERIGEWKMRKRFIEYYRHQYSLSRLLFLSNAYTNIEIYNGVYPERIMQEIKTLVAALKLDDSSTTRESSFMKNDTPEIREKITINLKSSTFLKLKNVDDDRQSSTEDIGKIKENTTIKIPTNDNSNEYNANVLYRTPIAPLHGYDEKTDDTNHVDIQADSPSYYVPLPHPDSKKSKYNQTSRINPESYVNSAVFESDSSLVESDPIAIPGVFRNEAPYKGTMIDYDMYGRRLPDPQYGRDDHPITRSDTDRRLPENRNCMQKTRFEVRKLTHENMFKDNNPPSQCRLPIDKELHNNTYYNDNKYNNYDIPNYKRNLNEDRFGRKESLHENIYENKRPCLDSEFVYKKPLLTDYSDDKRSFRDYEDTKTCRSSRFDDNRISQNDKFEYRRHTQDDRFEDKRIAKYDCRFEKNRNSPENSSYTRNRSQNKRTLFENKFEDKRHLQDPRFVNNRIPIENKFEDKRPLLNNKFDHSISDNRYEHKQPINNRFDGKKPLLDNRFVDKIPYPDNRFEVKEPLLDNRFAEKRYNPGNKFVDERSNSYNRFENEKFNRDNRFENEKNSPVEPSRNTFQDERFKEKRTNFHNRFNDQRSSRDNRFEEKIVHANYRFGDKRTFQNNRSTRDNIYENKRSIEENRFEEQIPILDTKYGENKKILDDINQYENKNNINESTKDSQKTVPKKVESSAKTYARNFVRAKSSPVVVDLTSSPESDREDEDKPQPSDDSYDPVERLTSEALKIIEHLRVAVNRTSKKKRQRMSLPQLLMQTQAVPIQLSMTNSAGPWLCRLFHGEHVLSSYTDRSQKRAKRSAYEQLGLRVGLDAENKLIRQKVGHQVSTPTVAGGTPSHYPPPVPCDRPYDGDFLLKFDGVELERNNYISLVTKSAEYNHVRCAFDVQRCGDTHHCRLTLGNGDNGTGNNFSITANGHDAHAAKYAASERAIAQLQKVHATVVVFEEHERPVTRECLDAMGVNESQKISDDNVGRRMMQKLGWDDSGGLGSSGQGIVKPIDGGGVRARCGLGGGPDKSFEENIRKLLTDYLTSDGIDGLVFDNRFTKDERYVIHTITDGFKMRSRSSGFADVKRLQVHKKISKEDLLKSLRMPDFVSNRYKLYEATNETAQ